jgi:hypothetical protein
MCKTTQWWADSEIYINLHVEHALPHLIFTSMHDHWWQWFFTHSYGITFLNSNVGD